MSEQHLKSISTEPCKTWKALAERLREYGYAVDDVGLFRSLSSAAEGLEILSALQEADPEQNVRPAEYVKPFVDLSLKP